MLVVIAVAAVGAGSLVDQLGATYSSRPYFELAVAWGGLVVLALGAIGARWRGPGRDAALCAVVAIDAFVLFVAPQFSAPRAIAVDTGPVTYLRQHLGERRFFTLGPLAPDYGSYFGIGEANINDVPIPALYSDYVRRRLDQYVDPTLFVGNSEGSRNPFVPTPTQQLLRNVSGYRAAGVAYILSPVGQNFGPSGGVFTLAARTPTTNIYRLSRAAPYFALRGASCG